LYNIKRSTQYLLWNDVNAQKYIIGNLNAKLLLIIKNFFLNEVYIFQDGYALCRWAKIIKEWMKKQS